MNFEMNFENDDDTVYLAYSRPYPYTEIVSRLFEIEEDLQK